MMQFNEDRWIHHLKQQFPSSGPLMGIGDDCAVIPHGEDKAWLVTTDALVEGVHFLKEQISPQDLGYKTVAVNVSDVAAMGGTPLYAFLSTAFPKNIKSSWASDFILGLKRGCEQWNIQLLGGDTVGSKRDIFINLTLIGSAIPEHIKYRNQAQIQDIICLTGPIGDAGGGLQALQENSPPTEATQALIHAHFHPKPHLQQALWLASHTNVHAMMDLSDGLDCDLKRLIQSSQCGAQIETTKIPLSKALLEACKNHSWDPLKFALTGGEDYCLLLTVSPGALASIQQSYQSKFGTSLYAIGHITDQPGQLVYHQNGRLIQPNYPNFDHFH